jgi:hypothetical protein
MKHCCENLEKFVSEGEISLFFSSRERFYGINYKPRTGGGIQLIEYCPWCGTKLPKNLIDEYAELVFDELGLDPLDTNYNKKMPKEFKTDEWWKNRGL